MAAFMSKNMKILQKNICHDFFYIHIARKFHTFFNHWCTKIVQFDSILLVFIIKVVIIFKMVIFHLEILKIHRCVNASLRLQRILVKIAIHRFLGSLNPNLVSDFRNLKWRIQYGGQHFEKCSELEEIVRTQVFGVAESKSVVRFSISKMASRMVKKVRNLLKVVISCF